MIILTSAHRNKHTTPTNQTTSKLKLKSGSAFYMIPVQPFSINQNKYRCIKASSDWRTA